MDKQTREKAAAERSTRAVNMGGCYFEIKALGADEALEKLDALAAKLREVNDLIAELSLAKVEIQTGFVPENA